MSVTCLDSWAVIAWLENVEPAKSIVDEAIESRSPVMSWINVAEVHYRVRRKFGAETANAITNSLRTDLDIELPTERRILEAAIIKADNPIALADCFALSTAKDNDAVLLTGDPEIIGLADPPCEVRDLRG